jgi:hypothetical protein
VRFSIRCFSLGLLLLAGTARAQCTSPVFTTSDPNGGWSNGGYYVHNNMWNDDAGLGPETLYACSYRNWYVVSDQVDNAGAVKTYPNVHKDYNNVALGSFAYLATTFAASTPHVGIYNVAYDIWLNGVATSGSNEVMIWTENYKQVPAGTMADTVSLGGRSFSVWKTANNRYIAFVPASAITSGSLDLLELLNWIKAKGWIPSNSTLGQVCYGVEIVSTGGASAKFTFTDFSISTTPPNAVRRPGPKADPAASGNDYFTLTGKRVDARRKSVASVAVRN